MSTLEARQGVNPTNNHLTNFWQKAYKTINIANQIIEKQDVMESERLSALQYRTYVFSLLSIVFGDVPLVLEYLPGNLPQRIPIQDVYDYMIDALNQQIVNLPQSDAYVDALYLKGRILLQQSQYPQARAAFQALFDSGVLSSKIGENNNELYIQSLLLYADATNETGDASAAAVLVNQLCALLEQAPALPNGSSQAQVRTEIRNKFAQHNTGLKYLNISRWNLNADWGYKKYLPVPMSVMDSNPDMVQNPGW